MINSSDIRPGMLFEYVDRNTPKEIWLILKVNLIDNYKERYLYIKYLEKSNLDNVKLILDCDIDWLIRV